MSKLIKEGYVEVTFDDAPETNRLWAVVDGSSIALYTNGHLTKRNRSEKTVAVLDPAQVTPVFAAGEGPDVLHVRRLGGEAVEIAAGGREWEAALLLSHAPYLDEFSEGALMEACLAGGSRAALSLMKTGFQAVSKRVFAAIATRVVFTLCQVPTGCIELVTAAVLCGANVRDVAPDGTTVATWAGRAGHTPVLDTLSELVDGGAELGVGGARGETPLWVAAEAGHADFVTAVCQSVADQPPQSGAPGAPPVGPNTVNIDGASALGAAFVRGHTHVVRALVSAGADVNGPGDARRLPLHECCRWGRVDAVNELLAQGADVAAAEESGETALHVVARVGGPPELLAVVLSRVGEAGLNACRADGATPLLLASSAGAEAAVDSLLAAGADPNRANVMNQTPLFVACLGVATDSEPHLAVAVRLIGANAGLDVACTLVVPSMARRSIPDPFCYPDGFPPPPRRVLEGDVKNLTTLETLYTVLWSYGAHTDRGWTPLMLAVANNSLDLVSRLLAAGADPSARSSLGFTPLHLATFGSSKAPIHTDVVAALLDAGADPSPPVAVSGSTPLLAAAPTGCVESVKRLLAAGADVTVCGVTGALPLMRASKFGETAIVTALLDAGADVNAVRAEQCKLFTERSVAASPYAGRGLNVFRNADPCLGILPALAHAKIGGHVATARVLQERGATDGGVTEAWVHIGELITAVKAGDAVEVKRLLAANPELALTRDNGGQTALHAAANSATLFCMRFLLDAGADINAVDDNGDTPLDVACRNSYTLPATGLLICGADPNSRGSYSPPLHVAVERGDVGLVRVLLSAGADVDIRDSDGRTPLHVAGQAKNTAIAGMLASAGADSSKCPQLNTNGPDVEEGLRDGSMFMLSFDIRDGTQNMRNKILAAFGINYRSQKAMHSTLCDFIFGKEKLDWFVLNALLDSIEDYNAIRRSDGNTLLTASCSLRDDLSDTLLSALLVLKGADINKPRANGDAPLHAALSVFGLSHVVFLLGIGADVNAYGSELRTPLQFVCVIRSNASPEEVDEMLYPGVAVLLLGGADPNIYGRNSTWRPPLLSAASNGYVTVVRALLEHGANIEIVSEEGYSAFAIACNNNNVDMMEVLAEYGADIHGKLDSLRPLHAAAGANSIRAATWLLDHGVDVNLPWMSDIHYDGVLPIHTAIQRNHARMVQFLIGKGANINSHCRCCDESILDYAREARAGAAVVKVLKEHYRPPTVEETKAELDRLMRESALACSNLPRAELSEACLVLAGSV